MTKLQKLRLEMADAIKAANKIKGDKRLDELTAEEREQYDNLQANALTLGHAIRSEEEVNPEESGEHIEASQGETAEIRALVGRSNLGVIVGAIAQGQPVEGAERELQQAQNLDVNQIPWEMLAGSPRRIQAADVATEGPSSGLPTNQNPIIARVFSRTAAAYLGVMFPSVPVGQSSYPVLTGGATGEVKAKGAGKDAQKATWSVKTVSPTRLTARYVYRIEDQYSLMGLEEALRMDLTDVLGEALDAAILTGDGQAPNPAGFFDSDSGLTIPAAASDEADAAAYLAAVMAEVDGKHAAEPSEVRQLVGPATLQHMGNKFITGTSDTALEKVRNVSGGVRVSAHVPAVASKAQLSLFSRGMGYAVAPTWRAPSVIRDEVTKAESGEVALTILQLFAFQVVRASGYGVSSFKLEA